MPIHRSVFMSLLLLVIGGEVGVAQEQTTNVLKAGDELILRVWPDTTLSGRYRVETDGRVYLPMVGALEVVDRSLEDVRGELVGEYSEVMRSPIVVIVPRFRVSVLGAVRSPGLYFVEPPATLMDLVSLAGGFLENAEPDRVRLLRGGEAFGVDAELALETGSQTAAVPLQSGDRVVVPRQGTSGWRIFQVVTSVTMISLQIARFF